MVRNADLTLHLGYLGGVILRSSFQFKKECHYQRTNKYHTDVLILERFKRSELVFAMRYLAQTSSYITTA